MSAATTPLALLIAEQKADDTYWITTRRGEVSLDAPWKDGTVGSELVGRDPWELVDAAIDLSLDPGELAYAGDVYDAFRPKRGCVLTDPRDTDHGTVNAYVNRKCRCEGCRAAMAQYMRAYRAERKAAA